MTMRTYYGNDFNDSPLFTASLDPPLKCIKKYKLVSIIFLKKTNKAIKMMGDITLAGQATLKISISHHHMKSQ